MPSSMPSQEDGEAMPELTEDQTQILALMDKLPGQKTQEDIDFMKNFVHGFDFMQQQLKDSKSKFQGP